MLTNAETGTSARSLPPAALSSGALPRGRSGPLSVPGSVRELEPLIKGVWAELSASARHRQVEVLASAIEGGIPEDELGERINASERTQLLTGFALNAATRTAWQDKLRTLGRSLASGLLADDNAKIDTEQMIIAAITDIEGPQLALLELLVCWRQGLTLADPLISGPLDLPEESRSQTADGSWDVIWRDWSRELIAHARPNLVPIAPSLLGTLQRHGLVVQNDNTGETIQRFQGKLESALKQQYAQDNQAGGGYRPRGALRLSAARDMVREPTWSPTELGEQVFLRFRDAGTELPDVWKSGPADQQETETPSESAGH
jgi:hypothetical protein